MAGRHRALSALGALLVVSFVCLAVPAGSSLSHPAPVATKPAVEMPQLVPSEAIPQPHVDALAEGGSWIAAGGSFERVERGGATYPRSNIVVFDRNSGLIEEDFAPEISGGDVLSLAADPATNSVFVGGTFSHVNGVERPALAKIDAATGALDTSFSPTFAGGRVNDLEIVQIAGTRHLLVGGTPGRKIFSLSPSTGRDDRYLTTQIADAIPGAWGGVAIYQFAVDPAKRRLVATGNFQTVAGQQRTRFFMLNLGDKSGELADWYYPGFAKRCSSTSARRIAYLQGIDWSPDGRYFTVTATGQIPAQRSDIWYNRLGERNNPDTTVCDGVARFSVDDASRPIWVNYTGGDSVWSVSDTGSAVYVAGHFKWLDNPDGWASKGLGDVSGHTPASSRPGIGAIDPETGLATTWNPRLANSANGGKTFLADADGLWIGNDATRYGGTPRNGLMYARLPARNAVVWAVGDSCDHEAADCAAVGQLISRDADADAVLGLGNLQYSGGTLTEYNTLYDTMMGSGVGLREKTYPVPGPVDYRTANASGYFDYWGVRAGDPTSGYYSVDLAGWRLIAANSNCSKVGGCGGAQPQGQWMRPLLADTKTSCELVFASHPAFSDGEAGDTASGRSLFTISANNGADLYVSAGDRTYQRFAARRPDGIVDATGLTSFVVGTGGQSLAGWRPGVDRAAFRQNAVHGALRLVLGENRWASQYYNTAGDVVDAASGTCR